jgi:hypothetical protein
LGDVSIRKDVEKQLREWMKKIEKSGLPGKYKAWIYQNGILLRMMWMLTLYEFPVTAVKGMERHISSLLQKWLGAPPS